MSEEEAAGHDAEHRLVPLRNHISWQRKGKVKLNGAGKKQGGVKVVDVERAFQHRVWVWANSNDVVVPHNGANVTLSCLLPEHGHLLSRV